MIEYLVVVLFGSVYWHGSPSFMGKIKAPYTIDGFASPEACKNAAANLVDAKKLASEALCIQVNKETGAVEVLVHYSRKDGH